MIEWSCYAVSLTDSFAEPLVDESPDRVLATASIGKVLLLDEVARRLSDGSLDPGHRVRKDSVPVVRDSGLWWLLDQRDLTVVDACRLVGAVSDNLATNVLLDLVGVDALVPHGTVELLDFVRDERSPEAGHPPTLSRASARSLVSFFRTLHEGSISPLVGEWLSLNTDLSMVASAFLLDPLAHPDGLINKTGTDDGIRADAGIVRRGDEAIAYAAIANWDPAEDELAEVMAGMRRIGERLS